MGRRCSSVSFSATRITTGGFGKRTPLAKAGKENRRPHPLRRRRSGRKARTNGDAIGGDQMATRTKAKQERDRYLELVRAFPLRPIRSDEQLDQAIEVIASLLDREQLEPGEKDYLDVLSDQVERYEETNVPIPRASDAEILRHLIEAKGV